MIKETMKYLFLALTIASCDTVPPEDCEPITNTDAELWYLSDLMEDDATKFGIVYLFEAGNVPPITHLNAGEFVWHIYNTKPLSEWYLISKNDSVRCLNHF